MMEGKEPGLVAAGDGLKSQQLNPAVVQEVASGEPDGLATGAPLEC
jgi:hypothetical protein